MSANPRTRKLDTRLATLTAAHRALHHRIEQLVADGFSDELELQRLKKRKLALKDRMTQLEDATVPDIIA